MEIFGDDDLAHEDQGRQGEDQNKQYHKKKVADEIQEEIAEKRKKAKELRPAVLINTTTFGGEGREEKAGKKRDERGDRDAEWKTKLKRVTVTASDMDWIF